MKGRNVLRAMLVVALLAVVFAVPASADKPEIDFTLFQEDGIYYECEPFEMPYHDEWRVKYTLWNEKNGNAPGESYVAQEFFTIYYNGRELTFHSQLHFHFTWISTEQTLTEFSGSWPTVTIPGHGIVSASVGRGVDLTTCHLEGEELICETEYLHTLGMNFEDLETICNYMVTGE